MLEDFDRLEDFGFLFRRPSADEAIQGMSDRLGWLKSSLVLLLARWNEQETHRRTAGVRDDDLSSRGRLLDEVAEMSFRFFEADSDHEHKDTTPVQVWEQIMPVAILKVGTPVPGRPASGQIVAESGRPVTGAAPLNSNSYPPQVFLRPGCLCAVVQVGASFKRSSATTSSGGRARL